MLDEQDIERNKLNKEGKIVYNLLKKHIENLSDELKELDTKFKQNVKDFKFEMTMDHTHDVNNHSVYTLYDINSRLEDIERDIKDGVDEIECTLKQLVEATNLEVNKNEEVV